MSVVSRPAAWLAALAGLLLAGAAGAAPLPTLRTTPAPDALRTGRVEATGAAAIAGARGIESLCGTRLELGVEMVAAHAARELNAPLPTPHSTDVGEIAVLEDDGTFFFSDKNGNVIADLAAIGQSFYRTHDDDYDCLAIFLSSGLTTWLGSPSAIAAAYILRNDIQGIGMDPFDYGANMGSASRLQWMLSMNGLHKFPADPYADISGDTFSTMDVIAHEFGHRWLAYTFIDSAGLPSPALLGRSHQHWSFFFDSDGSLMEGSQWESPAPDTFEITELSERFGPLDLYLMGLRSAADTGPFTTLHDATDFNPPGDYNRTSWGSVGLGCDARAFQWTVADLEALNGPRVPDASIAPHVFRMGVVLVTARGNDATPDDLAELEFLRTEFASNFSTLTQGFGTVDVSLDSKAGSVRIAHEPVKDQPDFQDPIELLARIDIHQAGIPLALDPASPTAWWRLGDAGPFSPIPMGPAGPDSFVAMLPASPGYLGTVQYYLTAASDSAGIEATDPPAGPAGPYAFTVGPDQLSPVIVHSVIPAQGEGRMPVTLLARVTDNMAVDSVWVQWGVDGGNGNFTPMVPAGRDTFTLTLGAGLLEGQTLNYSISALDAAGLSAIHQSMLQGGQPWELAVGRDWHLDFENGLEGLFHAPIWFSYRNAWHPTTEQSSPPGGTAWKCGDEAPRPYPVHVDAALYTPWIPSVTPGTLLRFDHRYVLEEANASLAWDGARLEAQVGAGPWVTIEPQAPYSHAFFYNSNPWQAGVPCWSGTSGGWRSEVFDLSALAPGPARVRFRMLADDFAGFDGWIVDAMEVDFPGDVSSVPPGLAAGSLAPWPNPATDRLTVQLALPRAGTVEWSLMDLAGRRVARLAETALGAGPAVLEAALPAHLPAGLYFSRLTAPGMPPRTSRVALLR